MPCSNWHTESETVRNGAAGRGGRTRKVVLGPRCWVAPDEGTLDTFSCPNHVETYPFCKTNGKLEEKLVNLYD